jgi:hypothetical protein
VGHGTSCANLFVFSTFSARALLELLGRQRTHLEQGTKRDAEARQPPVEKGLFALHPMHSEHYVPTKIPPQTQQFQSTEENNAPKAVEICCK